MTVIRGEPGAGKTALLEYVAAGAGGCRIVRAAGVESEMELAYAGLHQLCVPFLGRLERLPAPQREALGTAFGLRPGQAPDRFLVGLAVLSLLADIADEQPLVCIVDDAQWLDHESAQVLGFVARRLAAESVALLFALRESSEDRDLVRLPELRVGPLLESDARALLASAMPGRIDEAVRDRIVAEAQGNPLALLELPRGWTREAFAGGFGLPHSGSAASRVEQSFLRRLAPLPPETRQLLLLAAADQTGDAVLVGNAAARLGIPPAAAEVAREAGLLDSREQLRFRHPLVRSVVYRDATAGDRRLAHEALAAVTAPDADPDRRVWHLAMAAPGADEGIARELEQSAGRAEARGGMAAAAAFLRHAVTLTREPAQRARRALAAAHASAGSGAFDEARELLTTAETGPLDELERARVERLRAEIAYRHGAAPDSALLLARAARRLEGLDARLSRDTYLDAWGAALLAGGLATVGGSVRDVSRAAATAPAPLDAPRPRDVLLDGLALVFTEGRSAAAPVLRRAVEAFAGGDASLEEMFRWGWLATRAANVLWDYDRCIGIGTRAVQLAREAGALEVLAIVDNGVGQAAAVGGDFATAAVLAAEVDAVNEATGSRMAPLAALASAGLRGREAEASSLIAGVIPAATAGGQGAGAQYARWAQAVLMNGLGRYDEALPAARHASEEVPELFIATWALIELIEAAARTGKTDLASAALTRLRAQTEATETDWALGVYARSAAVVAEADDAEGLYREAIDRLSRTRLRPDLARAHLVYGEWLRRKGRRVDGRDQLRTAFQQLATLGMEAFAERARRELLATGERVRPRSPQVIHELTPQEEQIGRLARDGLSNIEIGAQLFLSPRTVEWHLRKVFAKLGVSSRRELRRVLPDDNGPAVAV